MEAKDRNTEAEPISAETLAAINASNDIRNADGTKHIITADELRLAYPTRRECEIIAEVAKNEAARDVPEFMRIFTKRHAAAIKRAYKISPELAVDIFFYAFEYICNAAEMLKRYTDAKPQTKDEDAAQWAEVEEIVSLHNCIAAHGYEFVMAADGLRRMWIHYGQCLWRAMGDDRYTSMCQKSYAAAVANGSSQFAVCFDLGGRNAILHIAEFEELCKAFADAGTQGNALEPIPADAGIFSCLQGVANLPPDVTTAARCILFVMFAFRNSKTGDCFPTVATIAKCAGLSLPHTKRLLRDLRERGYLQVGKRKTRNGGGNTYTLCLPNAQKVSSTIPTDMQKVSSTIPTDSAEGIIHDTQMVSSTIPEHRILEQRSFEQRECVCDIGTPTLEAVLAFANSSNIPSWYARWWFDEMKKLDWATMKGKVTTDNFRYALNSWWNNSDEDEKYTAKNHKTKEEKERIEEERTKKVAAILWTGCRKVGCRHYTPTPTMRKSGWNYCALGIRPEPNKYCQKYDGDYTPPQSPQAAPRATTSAREARDGDYPF